MQNIHKSHNEESKAPHALKRSLVDTDFSKDPAGNEAKAFGPFVKTCGLTPAWSERLL